MAHRPRYLAKRAIFLIATLIIATYLTVLISNAGGMIDEILRAQIKYDITSNLARTPGWAQLSDTEKTQLIGERFESAMKARGLDRPFIERTFIYLWDALSLSLGRALFLSSAAGSREVRAIILERLPLTALLFTTGTVIYSIVGLLLGLRMAQKPGGIFDKVAGFFAVVTQVIPPWFFGILFLLLFAYYLRIVPFGGMTSVPAPIEPWPRFADILYHMALPLFTWVFSLAGSWAYVARNLFVQIAEEDFVMAARAKGLQENAVMRRYVLRPALPPITTSIALALVGSWQGAIITETVFNWPGLGSLFAVAIAVLDAPVVIGLTVVYAYLLVVTILILDLTYSLMDPRINA